jgi:hypothetical protein
LVYELNIVVIDLSFYIPEMTLVREGHEGTCVLALGNEVSTVTGNRKVVLILTPPFLDATSRKNITIHNMPDPVKPFPLHVFSFPTRRREKTYPRNPSYTPQRLYTTPILLPQLQF